MHNVAQQKDTKLQPHQQRVVEDKDELNKKATDLSNFIGTSPIFDTLDPVEQERLKEQNDVMWQYFEILEARIAAFRPSRWNDLFDGSNAHELCSACAGTGKVLDGEICRFCDGRGWDFSGLQLAIETLDSLGYSDMAESVLNLCHQVYNAPVAIMDTRDALGICAPTEAGFPALYALQGKRVRLVLDEAPNVELTGSL